MLVYQGCVCWVVVFFLSASPQKGPMTFHGPTTHVQPSIDLRIRSCWKRVEYLASWTHHVFFWAMKSTGPNGSLRGWYMSGMTFPTQLCGDSFIIPWNVQDPYMGVSKNRDTQKWMVYSGKPIKIDDLGVPLFLEQHPYQTTSICHEKVSGRFFFSWLNMCWGRWTVHCFPWGINSWTE